MKAFATLFAAGSLAVLLFTTGTTHAQSATGASKMGDVRMGDVKLSGGAAAAMTDAEVRKVDKEQGKVTLKHGPIANLDMPGMTMVFYVKDKAMLDNVKAGDKVRFKAVDDHGKMTVSEIQPVK